jgi:acetyl coenzyme A synthetase (ADP forming)-like protein
MGSFRPRYLPIPYQDSLQSGRLLLRDGSAASVRVATSNDEKALADFFATLSEQSKRQRFFSATVPQSKLVESFCDASDPRVRMSLIVTRLTEQGVRIIATANYVARDETTAEIALAVSDRFQRQGIATLLLERLALAAVANGFRRFWAVTMAENRAILDVFRDSGFEYVSRYDSGYVEIDLSVVPSAMSVARAELRDRVVTTASILPIFQPRSVAVIGASRNPESIGARILNALIDYGFRGAIYPVNPHATTLASLAVYPTVAALPEPVDLAVITTPKETVLSVVDHCAARGVRALLIITAGFAEIGAAGQALQRELVEKVRGYGMRMVGPNCLGLINTDPVVRLNASFAPHTPPPGRVAFFSQSGALGLAIISLARERELGLSSFISVGNKADISSNDLLQYWEEDRRSEVILLYLESFGNPRRFARIAARVTQRKPIVVVKAGRTGAGRRAAGSHTAALAANDVAADALFHQTGIIRADTLDEMFDLAEALSSQPLPNGRRVALLTNAGGLGILCADACEAAGLNVQPLSEERMTHLRHFLPNTASVGNPVDMIASATAQDFRRATEILLASAEIDALIVLTIHVGLADIKAISQAICSGVSDARARGGSGKTVLTCIMDSAQARKPITDGFERLPNFAFPENAARVLGKLASYSEWRRQPQGMIPEFDDVAPATARRVCEDALKQRGSSWLSAAEARDVLTAFRLPIRQSDVCCTAEEAARVAKEIGYPVALKLASSEIIHKTEAGGVQLNLANDDAVQQAFAAIRDRLAAEKRLDAMEGVIVQPMISGGVEVMIGVTQDPLFGPLIGFGLGGVHVEILNDICFRVTPITDRDARDMIRSIRGYRLLQGYRGHAPADVSALEELLLRVSRLVEEIPEIAELDLNPVFALSPGQGCTIVDARIRITG